nr:VOC family protein [Planomonospora venezuelensis]
MEFYQSVFGGHLVAFTNAGDRAFFVSVRGKDADEITAYWKGLSDDATVIEDLGPAGWTPLYGMLKDRFGVTWVLDVAVEYSAG